MKANTSLLDLLLELQSLDRLPRTGYLMRGISDPESVAEHSWHVVFLVWAVGQRIPRLDLLRAMEIALVHDLAEARFGDLPMTAGRFFPPRVKEAAESAALAEMTAPLSSRSTDRFAEFVEGKTAEARFVRACDKLQLMLKVWLYESQGATGLKGFWQNEENFVANGFAEIESLYEEIKERRSADSGEGSSSAN